MVKNHVETAVGYYMAMKNRDVAGLEARLHPQVQFIGPLAEMTGREAVLASAKKFFGMVSDITIRAKFAAGDQVVLVYNLDCPPPIGNFRASVLMTFKEDLISCIELFYDARPFERKKDEIFSSAKA